MTRTYELGFIVEPRQNDDDVQALTERFTSMLEEAGSTVTYIDYWGKRKLAYPIRKFNEGKYVFVYVSAETTPPPWPEIERLMQQDEKVLRHLVVRTDEDLKRAFRKGKVKPEVPGTTTEESDAEGAESAEGDDKPAAAKSEDKPAKADDKKSEDKPAKSDEKPAKSEDKKADAEAEKKAEDKKADDEAEKKADDEKADDEAEKKADDEKADDEAEKKADDEAEKKAAASDTEEKAADEGADDEAEAESDSESKSQGDN